MENERKSAEKVNKRHRSKSAEEIERDCVRFERFGFVEGVLKRRNTSDDERQ